MRLYTSGIGLLCGVVLAAGTFGMAAPASALTIDDVQTKIQALLQQIADLTRQINQLRGEQQSIACTADAMQCPDGSWVGRSGPKCEFSCPGAGAGTPTITPRHRVCTIISRTLGQGAQGDDVRGLQEFLHDEGYLSADATGYYGALTLGAVAKWQAAEGVSAVGIVGPASRERIKLWCSGEKGSLKAYPTSGSAPLAVSFWRVLGDSPADGYSIDFGDGTTGTLEIGCGTPPNSGVMACPRALVAAHTYAQAGTYTAKLFYQQPYVCNGAIDTPCTNMMPVNKLVGSLDIHVGSIACTMEYAPVCGLKPIVCITTPCNPVPTTYSNRCMMNADGATFSYEGKCRADTKKCTPRPACLDNPTSMCNPIEPAGGWCPKKCTPRPACLDATPRCLLPEPAEGWCPSTTDPADDPQCKSWFDGCNTCTRSEPGGPAMCTMRACMGPVSSSRCTSRFDGTTSSNKPPVISSFSGPTTLSVNGQGTWTIQASDPEDGTLSYDITWGDERYAVPLAGISAAHEAFVQTTTFTHSYAAAGTYTVSIVVRDSAGMEARTSSTVGVTTSSVACTREYRPVCGRPSCGASVLSGCYSQAVKTYSNRCSLDAASADFVHEGACTSQD